MSVTTEPFLDPKQSGPLSSLLSGPLAFERTKVDGLD
jgi:hypothetical protein